MTIAWPAVSFHKPDGCGAVSTTRRAAGWFYSESPFARWSDYLVRTRGSRVCGMMLVMWLLSAFDYAFTDLALRHGLADECNPLACWAMSHGAWALLFYKAGLVSAVTVILVLFRQCSWAELVALTAVAVLLLVAWRWNVMVGIYDYAEAIRPAGYIDRDPVWLAVLTQPS